MNQEMIPYMPDATITVNDMKDYGYMWDGMLPLQREAAAKLFERCEIFRLYPDDSDGLVESLTELQVHEQSGGIFGIEKTAWLAELNRRSNERGVLCNIRKNAAPER